MLAPRLAMLCKGTAWGQVKAISPEKLTDKEHGVENLLAALASWEESAEMKTYELFEKVIYKTMQKSDESTTSFVNRLQVAMDELGQVTVKHFHAFLLLRQSALSQEDKKRVLTMVGGEIETKKVEQSMRTLATTVLSAEPKKKIYPTNFVEPEISSQSNEDESQNQNIFYTHAEEDDVLTVENIEYLAQGGDEDAMLIQTFEKDFSDMMQDIPDLQSALLSYHEARQRISDRRRSRGFWPSRGRGKGGGKDQGKGFRKGGQRSSKEDLLAKIARTHCKVCGALGHWKAECPRRDREQAREQANVVHTEEGDHQDLLQVHYEVSDEDMPPPSDVCFTVHSFLSQSNPRPSMFSPQVCRQASEFMSRRLSKHWQNLPNGKSPGRPYKPDNLPIPHRTTCEVNKSDQLNATAVATDRMKPFPAPTMTEKLISSGLCPIEDSVNQVSCHQGMNKGLAILDTGASRSVIGSDNVPAVLRKLPENVRCHVREKPSKIGFRFGNNQVEYSFKQIQIPLMQGKHKIWLLIEVVPKATPFLLSIKAMKSLGALIDLANNTCFLTTLQRSLPLRENNNGLFVIDVADLCQSQPPASEAIHTASSDLSFRPPPGLELPDQASHADQTGSPCGIQSVGRGDHGKSSSLADDAVYNDVCNLTPGSYDQSGNASNSAAGDRGERPEGQDHGTQSADHRPCVSPGESEHVPWTVVRRMGSPRDGSRKQSSISRDARAKPCCTGPFYFDNNRFRDISTGSDLWWENEHEDCWNSNTWAPVAKEPSNASRSSSSSSHEQSDWKPARFDPSCSGYLGSKDRDMGKEEQRSKLCGDLRAGPRVCQVDPREDRISPRGHRRLRKLLPNQTTSGGSCTSADPQLSEWEPVPALSVRFQRSRQSEPSISDHDEVAWMKEVFKIVKNGGNRCEQWDVLEVYAYPNSQLTDVAISCGLKAKRFTLEDGDLSTVSGRVNLLTMIILHRPRHVWMSPDCKPWCAWSRFNAQRSVQGFHRVCEDQKSALVHVKLCNLIAKIQLSEGRHAHIENPWTSALWTQSVLTEFMQSSLSAKLDQCMFGLRHPESNEPMEKKTCIQTSSREVWKALDCRVCDQQHSHAQIAGQCRFRNHTMPLSKFAGFYPRTFAKAIIKGIIATKEGPIIKPTYHVDVEEPPSKRARIGGYPEANPDDPMDGWTSLFDKLKVVLPKSGISTWTNPFHEIFHQVQSLVPDERIGVIKAGKGLERYISGEHVWRQEFPMRHTVILHRSSREVEDLGSEDWSILSRLQEHRKAKPSHIMLCIFFEKPSSVIREDAADRNEVCDPPPVVETMPDRDLQLEPKLSTTSVDVPTWTPLTATVSGPKFLALNNQDQGTIRKLHRNLGHPTAEKLSRHLANMHVDQQLVEGAKDFQCESCAERHAPSKASPGNLKDPSEFNDRIYIDGFEWKSQSGLSVYVIHVLDEATRFHLGHRTLRDGQLLVKGVKDMWLQWAGIPKQIAHDPGGELVTDEWKLFLQENGIQPILSAAPWQRGRIERHGGIIKEMLSRMDQEKAITDLKHFDEALFQCFHAKNTLSVNEGFSPEQAVLGKASKLPASITSDEDLTSHLACDGHDLASDRFKAKLDLRASARSAFSQADNSSAIRRSLNRQSRGVIHSWSCGQLCMYWDKRKAPNMLEKGRWSGPAQVVCAESRTIVWISHLNRLLRCARENLRPVSLREFQRHSTFVQTSTQEQLQQMSARLQEQLRQRSGLFQYSDLSSLEPEEPQTTEAVDAPVGSQPEEEPNRRMSLDLAHDAENLQRALETPVPESPIATPPVEGGSSSDEPAADTESMESDEASETNMEPVYNATITENGVQSDILLEDVGSYWPNSDQFEAACASFSFDVQQQQFQRFLRKPEEYLDCLVAAAKKSRNEISYSDLNQEEKKLFQAAKTKELQCWLDTKTVKAILRDKIHPSRILSSRWILTWKEDLNAPSGRKAKARLVVKGFQDPDIDVLNSDSPTVTRDARMLLLQTISSKQWVVQSFDITTAFLRGRSDDRELAMEAPPELKQLMGMDQSQVCLLQGNAYGRVDAPLLFYREFRKRLEEIGFETHPLDNCLFLLRNPSNPSQLDGILGTHVDDGIGGGNLNFEKALEKLQKTLPFGTREYGKFKFTGLDIEQLPDYSIKVNQGKYIHKISPIDVPKSRRSDTQSPINAQELTQLRGLCGSLQYAAVHSRPDIATKVAHLQKGITSATVETLLEGNRVLREAQQFAETSVIVRPIPLNDICFASFGDASFASAKQLSAQQGLFIMACSPKLAQNETTEFSPIVWHSKQIGRVVRSTLSAEAYSMSSSLDKLTWIRSMWGYIKDPRFEWHRPEKSLEKEPKGLMITDCKSLYDLVTKNAVPNCQEWRTTIEVMLLKEQSKNHTMCRWVSTAIMLADCLTKPMDATFMRTVLQLGQFRIYDEDLTLKQNATRKYGVTWVNDHMGKKG